MFHHVARAVPGRLLWYRDVDGLVLFDGLCRTFPELTALCLMPDHFHLLLPHADPDNRLYRALVGYACYTSARLGVPGPLWVTHPAAVALPDATHVRRTLRYVHLNPCRARLVADPLAWPFSTHRDAVGFAAQPVIAAVNDPEAFHRHVSGDPSVDTAGTPLPAAPFEAVSADQVASAVASVFRVTEEAVGMRHPARRAFVRAATFFGLPSADIARFAGITEGQRWRIARQAPTRGGRVDDPVLQACIRASGDPRFTALSVDDHRRDRRWYKYATRR
jgi:hypothetical protein